MWNENSLESEVFIFSSGYLNYGRRILPGVSNWMPGMRFLHAPISPNAMLPIDVLVVSKSRNLANRESFASKSCAEEEESKRTGLLKRLIRVVGLSGLGVFDQEVAIRVGLGGAAANTL